MQIPLFGGTLYVLKYSQGVDYSIAQLNYSNPQ